jgi:hypothetical protein
MISFPPALFFWGASKSFALATQQESETPACEPRDLFFRKEKGMGMD